MLKFYFQGYADTIRLATTFGVRDTRIETNTDRGSPHQSMMRQATSVVARGDERRAPLPRRWASDERAEIGA